MKSNRALWWTRVAAYLTVAAIAGISYAQGVGAPCYKTVTTGNLCGTSASFGQIECVAQDTMLACFEPARRIIAVNINDCVECSEEGLSGRRECGQTMISPYEQKFRCCTPSDPQPCNCGIGETPVAMPFPQCVSYHAAGSTQCDCDD